MNHDRNHRENGADDNSYDRRQKNDTQRNHHVQHVNNYNNHFDNGNGAPDRKRGT